MALANSPLDYDEFCARTIMPTEDVATVPRPFVELCLQDVASEIYAVLAKRYVTPFPEPIPGIVKRWQAQMVTPLVYERRGWNPGDEQSKFIVDAADRCRAQIHEAADAEKGLFGLPLKDGEPTVAISRGGPDGYSEASPYEWLDVQREVLRGR